MQEMHRYLSSKQVKMLDLLKRLVNIDSGSYCKNGIDRCGEIVGAELQRVGFRVDVIRETECGNHVRAVRKGKGNKQVLILAHLDTVWPAGTVEKRPFAVEDGFAHGPGVGDMKGGIVQMIYALDAISHFGLEAPPIVIFCTGDEELGSIRGRPYIEEEACSSAWSLVMESTVPPTTIVTRRWGVGAFDLAITGRGAHVLDSSASGVNACKELALKILALEGLSDYAEGVKVSVNLVRGGTARQVTAAEAWANIDVRVRDLDKMDSVESKIREVAGNPSLPLICLQLRGKMTRPPMEPNPNTASLLRLAVEISHDIGIEVIAGEKAGGSDGSFASALGVATLDGLGPLCYDVCSETERVDLSSLVPRTLLLAKIIIGLSGYPSVVELMH